MPLAIQSGREIPQPPLPKGGVSAASGGILPSRRRFHNANRMAINHGYGKNPPVRKFSDFRIPVWPPIPTLPNFS